MTELATLRDYLTRNRFMPAPPPKLMFCGDGDFRAIGAEFLERLVRDAGLKRQHRVLDIGCGVGRLAIPLTQYLDTAGTYDGIDPVAAGVAWCTTNITPVYPNARFLHLDVRHPLYNPQGDLETALTPLPFPDASFDLVTMISVTTYLGPDDVLHYARETARLLAPGGSCFATAFLMNQPARTALASGAGHLPFDPVGEGPLHYANPDAPLAAVGYDEDVLIELFLRNRLHRRAPAQYGNWSGRKSDHFQDICVFDKWAG